MDLAFQFIRGSEAAGRHRGATICLIQTSYDRGATITATASICALHKKCQPVILHRTIFSRRRMPWLTAIDQKR
jgi:hypothetical protein